MKRSNLIVTHIWATKNPAFVNVNAAQEVTDDTANPVGLFLGKSESRKRYGVQCMAVSHGIKVGDDLSLRFPGAIVSIKESTKPFYAGQEPKINPQTKQVMTHGGKPIYRYGIITLQGAKNAADELLAADTVEVAVGASAGDSSND